MALTTRMSAAEYLLCRSHPASPTFDVRFEVTETEVLTSPLLPGFAVEVGRVFRP